MRAFAIAALILVTGTTMHAEPSPSIRYLMRESVSMFEWGVFRLETRAGQFAWDDLDIPKQFARVDYDWAKNQLTLRLTVYPRYQSLLSASAKGACGSLIRQMKFHFGVAPRSEFLHELSGIGTFFRHQQFDKADAPATLDRDLESVTQLRVDVMASKSDRPPFQAMQSCSSDLLKSEISFFTTSDR
jgi:hypothetical protein